MKRVGLWSAVVCAAVALAQSPAAVNKLIEGGKFQEAYDAGIKLGDGTGLVLAALKWR